MSKVNYEHMKYSALKALYIEKCKSVGNKEPQVPRNRKDLIFFLNRGNEFGFPKAKVSLVSTFKSGVSEILGLVNKGSRRTGVKEEYDILFG